MMEIGFYHLTGSSLEEALPRLLEKVLASGKRAIVRTGLEARVEQLDRVLWIYRNDSFLPHGTRADGHSAQQPIYLTADDRDRPNGATVLLCVDGASFDDAQEFERCLTLFDGNDPQALATARQRWRDAKSSGHNLIYWQQNERGAWTRAN